MPTNVIEAGQARTYGSPWSTAGSAITEGLGQVLGYYQEYQRQKRFEMQQTQDAKIKAQEMAERAEQNKYIRESRIDADNARRAQNTAAKALMMDPNTDPAALPEEWVNKEVIKGQELAGPMPDGVSPLMGLDQTKLTPKKYVEFGEYVAPLDLGGQQAAATKRAEKQADWLPIREDFMGYRAGEKVPPAVWALANKQADEKTQFEHGPGGAIYSVGKDGQLNLAVPGKEPAMSPADRKALKDESENAMLDSIVPGNPETIPPQFRDMVVAFTEGRGIKPRAGTNVNLLQQMAWKYNPTLDMQTIETRGQLRKDLAKGSQTARGGQITSLNTLGAHLKSLQEAADELAGSSLANSGFATANWLAQKVTPSSTHGGLARYGEKANAVREEYIRALKGASPTETEIKAFAAIADTTISPAEREARIEALRELAEGRANAQESVWSGAFGKSSQESGYPMFTGEWEYRDGAWKLRGKGAKGAAAGKKTDPLGVLGEAR